LDTKTQAVFGRGRAASGGGG